MYEIELKAHVDDVEKVRTLLDGFAKQKGCTFKHDKYYKLSSNLNKDGYEKVRVRTENGKTFLTFKQKTLVQNPDGSFMEVNTESETEMNKSETIDLIFKSIGAQLVLEKTKDTEHWMYKTEKFDKMPNIFSTNNNINNINKKEKPIINTKKEQISELKFVLFNLPGQSTTLFTKKNNQNNIYYTDFLDRFIYFLYKEKEFDLSYKIILLGFGNGGHIALTYASFYEKYWNILDSVILFNAYCKNGTIINEAMLEILKTVTREKNPKKVEAFVKQNMRNPKEFNMKEKGEIKRNKINSIFGDEIFDIQKKNKNIFLNSNKKKESKSVHKLTNRIQNYYDNNKQNDDGDNNEDNIVNNMTLDGYKLITKGYFYNIPINLKEINTKILCVHSNVDSFINIHNISPLFGNDIPSYRVTPLKKFFINNNSNKNWNNNLNDINTVMGYDLNNFRNDENAKRKLIIFDGSHDITYNSNEKDNAICKVLISYFK